LVSSFTADEFCGLILYDAARRVISTTALRSMPLPGRLMGHARVKVAGGMERAGSSQAAAPQESDAGVDVLRGAVLSAAAGRGSVVLVRGPAGIGKSRLLNAAAALARPVLTLLVACGTELERELPFGAVLQLLEERVRRPPDVLSGPAGVAKPLFLDVGAGASDGSRDQQLTLIHGLYRLVADLAAREPLALLVDDAHEVDPPSLRFLAYLARRVRDLPVALVIALRPSHPGADAHLLGELVQTPGALRIEPGPLSGETVVRLVTEALGRRLDPAFARACVSVTGGNPLLVRELARGLAQQGTAGVAAEVELVNRIGPEPVAWAVEATLRRLPEPASKARQPSASLKPMALSSSRPRWPASTQAQRET
jgi:AAA ATPase domain